MRRDQPASRSTHDEDGKVHDIVGIGFGPANLALAIALEEARNAGETVPTAVFLERSRETSWHPGMLLPGARMQIPFPKDLATLRNPRSRYGFLNYLHEHGRLVPFLNLQTFFPSRGEFADYIAWAAETVDADVRHGVEVRRIGHRDGVARVHLVTEAGEEEVLRTRTVVLGTGLVPRMPGTLREGERVCHAIRVLPFLDSLPAAEGGSPRTFAVLGGGQSAAEITRHLHSLPERPVVHLIHDRYGLTPSDDSPFANRVFDPDAVEGWHDAPKAERRRLRSVHAGTNYSAVDDDLLRELAQLTYRERLTGEARLRMHDTTRMADAVVEPDAVRILLRGTMTGAAETLTVDALILATGFREPDPDDLLDGFGTFRDRDGDPVVDRDYRLHVAEGAPGVYLNGGVEASHGFSSSLLSLVSVRAGEILEALMSGTGGRGGSDARV